MAAILFSWDAQNQLEVNQMSGFQATAFTKISCIGYNVNLQTAVAAILIFVEYPKSIMFEALLVQRPYKNVKSTSGFQTTALTSNILYRVQC